MQENWDEEENWSLHDEYEEDWMEEEVESSTETITVDPKLEKAKTAYIKWYAELSGKISEEIRLEERTKGEYKPYYRGKIDYPVPYYRGKKTREDYRREIFKLLDLIILIEQHIKNFLRSMPRKYPPAKYPHFYFKPEHYRQRFRLPFIIKDYFRRHKALDRVLKKYVSAWGGKPVGGGTWHVDFEKEELRSDFNEGLEFIKSNPNHFRELETLSLEIHLGQCGSEEREKILNGLKEEMIEKGLAQEKDFKLAELRQAFDDMIRSSGIRKQPTESIRSFAERAGSLIKRDLEKSRVIYKEPENEWERRKRYNLELIRKYNLDPMETVMVNLGDPHDQRYQSWVEEKIGSLYKIMTKEGIKETIDKLVRKKHEKPLA